MIISGLTAHAFKNIPDKRVQTPSALQPESDRNAPTRAGRFLTAKHVDIGDGNIKSTFVVPPLRGRTAAS